MLCCSTNSDLLLCAVFTIICTASIAQVEETTVVGTTKGAIKGVILRVEGQLVARYVGIPYAEPPIGVRRFQVGKSCA